MKKKKSKSKGNNLVDNEIIKFSNLFQNNPQGGEICLK